MSRNSEVRSQTLASIEALDETLPFQGATKDGAKNINIKAQGLGVRLGEIVKEFGLLKTEISNLQEPNSATVKKVEDTLADVSEYGDVGRQFKQAKGQMSGVQGSLESVGATFAGLEDEMGSLSDLVASVQKRVESSSTAFDRVDELIDGSIEQTNGAMESLQNWVEFAADQDS